MRGHAVSPSPSHHSSPFIYVGAAWAGGHPGVPPATGAQTISLGDRSLLGVGIGGDDDGGPLLLLRTDGLRVLLHAADSRHRHHHTPPALHSSQDLSILYLTQSFLPPVRLVRLKISRIASRQHPSMDLRRSNRRLECWTLSNSLHISL